MSDFKVEISLHDMTNSGMGIRVETNGKESDILKALCIGFTDHEWFYSCVKSALIISALKIPMAAGAKLLHGRESVIISGTKTDEGFEAQIERRGEEMGVTSLMGLAFQRTPHVSGLFNRAISIFDTAIKATPECGTCTETDCDKAGACHVEKEVVETMSDEKKMNALIEDYQRRNKA